ncbi:MAG: hypothetical protein GYA24_08175 [Candidatus Lokiarchaeota archaeon]|nr:hypothetical protein [Candidatus Lokiarchaeota archaeon]
MTFTCFHTVYKEATIVVPVTIGYDASPSVRPWLASRDAPQFIHSGNWWTIKPGKRTREIVLDRQLALVNTHTVGLMSTNVQPGNDPLYWLNDDKEEKHLQDCLDNANYARDEAKSRRVSVPVYCTLQPASARAAEAWFQKAIDAGHRHLCMGVSEFLRSPRYRNEGVRRVLEITRVIKRLLGAKSGAIHLSGLTSYNLLPIVAALGATSTDGSTPVQSALAYGTVFWPGSGKGTSASKLWEQRESIGWNCTCEKCRARPVADTLRSFQDPAARVDHNLATWEALVHEINESITRDPSSWFASRKGKLPPASKKPWELALRLLENK